MYIPFQNSSVSSFIPDDSKWVLGKMVTAATVVAAGVAKAKTASYWVASLSSVTGKLVA